MDVVFILMRLTIGFFQQTFKLTKKKKKGIDELLIEEASLTPFLVIWEFNCLILVKEVLKYALYLSNSISINTTMLSRVLDG